MTVVQRRNLQGVQTVRSFVVTNEQPDVCNQFGVRWVDTFSMLQSLNIQFDLRQSGQ